MNATRVVIRALVRGSSLALLFGLGGCLGDDVTFGPVDAGPRTDATVDATTSDAGDAGVDAAPLPVRVLLTYVGAAGEMVALDEASGQKLGGKPGGGTHRSIALGLEMFCER